jgi:integrase
MGVFLRKDSDIWWISYIVNGRQKRESSKSKNKKDAEKLLTLRKAAVWEGRLRLPKSNPPRLETWAKQFLETVSHPITKRRYKTSITSLEAHFRGARISQITPEGIEEYKLARLKEGVGPATVNRDLMVARLMLKRAERQRFIARNPFHDVDFLDERKGRRQACILTLEEEKRLLAVAPPLLRPIILLQTDAGMRIGKEVLPLKWTDLDLLNNQVGVRDSKTPAGKRTIPLTTRLRAELLQWRRLTGPDYSEYLFPYPLDAARHLQKIPKTWKRALKDAGISYRRIYDLRATFSSRMNAAGVPEVFVEQFLGHVGGLAQTYAKAIDDFRRQAIEKLEDFVQSKRVKSSDKRTTEGYVQ